MHSVQIPGQPIAMGAAGLESLSNASSTLLQISSTNAERGKTKDMDGTEPSLSLPSTTQDPPSFRKSKRKDHRGGKKMKRKAKCASIGNIEGPDLPGSDQNGGDVEKGMGLKQEREVAAMATTEVLLSEGKRHEDLTPAVSPIGAGLAHLEEGASANDGDDAPATDDFAAAFTKSEINNIDLEDINTTVSMTENMAIAHGEGTVVSEAKEHLTSASEEDEANKVDAASTTSTITGDDSATASSVDAVVVKHYGEGAESAVVNGVLVEENSVAEEMVAAVVEDIEPEVKYREDATLATDQDISIEAEDFVLVTEGGELDTTAEQNIITIEENNCQSSGVDDFKILPTRETVPARIEYVLQERATPAARTGSCKVWRASIEGPKDHIGAKGLYEVKPSPGKGLGMFATRKIPQGTRIIAEEALMIVADMSYSAVLPVFAELRPGEKAIFMDLAGAEDEVEAANLAWYMAEADKDVDPSRRIRMSYEDQAAVQMIFGANSFNVAADTSAIFPIASRINHSCVPNVYHTWNSNIGRLTVHALRDIARGKEILTTYIPAILTREQRNNDEHLGYYRFACSCPACDPRSNFFKQSVFRRANAVLIEEQLAPYFASSSLRGAFAGSAGPFSSAEDALRCAQLRVNLMMDEGILNMDLVKCIHEAGELALLCGDFEEALNCARSAVWLIENCAGKDSPHMAVLRFQAIEAEQNLRLCWSDAASTVGRYACDEASILGDPYVL